MALFSRSKVPGELVALLGASRPLASGVSREGAVFAFAATLAYDLDGQWHPVPWQHVERGGWNSETQQLSWTTVDGEAVQLELTEPGRLPQVFKERVNASIACSVTVPLSSTRTAVISARRDPAAPASALVWRVAPGKGTTADDVADDPQVALELARLRAEYDRG
jgi:hypothetical protein